MGKWSEETRRATAARIISIGLLELLGSAALIHLLARNPHLCPPLGRLVLRNDNSSACDTANRSGVYSAIMRCALRILREKAEELGREVWLQHVASKDNVIADDLSRGRVSGAMQAARRDGFESIRMVNLDSLMRSWEERLLRITRRFRRRKGRPSGHVSNDRI